MKRPHLSGTAGDPRRVELAPGYEIAPLVLGCWQLSGSHRRDASDPESWLRRLHRLADAGFTTFDCADIYDGVETLLGRFLRQRGRHEIQVHTKLVPDLEALPRISKRYVEAVVHRSLERLGVERLDLVQLHWWDFRVPAWIDTAGWLHDLEVEGKIARVGLTNFDAPRLEQILAAGVPIVTHQVQYSLLDRRPAGAMTALCRRHGIALLAYGTLAGGFLSQRWLASAAPEPPLPNRSLTKYRLIIEEFGGWALFQELLEVLAACARRHGTSLAAVALAAALDAPGVAAAIVGVSTSDRTSELRAALDLVLDATDRERLGAVLARATGPAGPVYGLERDRGGPHAAILRTDLNRVEA